MLLTQFQIGEYFGAVVCTMDVNSNGITDLVLISSPMYMDNDREGRVYVCLMGVLVNDSFIQCHYINLFVCLFMTIQTLDFFPLES